MNSVRERSAILLIGVLVTLCLCLTASNMILTLSALNEIKKPELHSYYEWTNGGKDFGPSYAQTYRWSVAGYREVFVSIESTNATKVQVLVWFEIGGRIVNSAEDEFYLIGNSTSKTYPVIGSMFNIDVWNQGNSGTLLFGWIHTSQHSYSLHFFLNFVIIR